jgi:preprotein translocase subunit SecA
LVAYKNEAFTLFGDLMNTIWTDFARMIFNVQVNVEAENGAPPPQAPFAAGGSSTTAGRVSYSGGSSAMGASAIAAAAAAAGQSGAPAALADGELDEGQGAQVVEQRVLDAEHQLGRNDACWCGSGKKYKRCHGA